MTGRELIEYIKKNQLENYIVVVCHDTGEDSYAITEIIVDEKGNTIELC